MTTISTVEDIIEALDSDPQLLEALRARLLTRELLELPQVVAQLAAQLAASQAEMRKEMARLAAAQADTQKQLERLFDAQATTADDLSSLKGDHIANRVHPRLQRTSLFS